MNIAEPFIRRPVATAILTAGLLLFGAMGYRQLPVSDLPTVDFPTIQVSAGLPGASPETMASAVATPLEKQFTTIAGLDSMTSTSAQGSTTITLQFKLDKNIDAAAQDVQTMIAKAAAQLPRDLPSQPTLQKVNPADQPILYLALSSATLPLNRLDEYAETMLAQRISTVSGVAQVQVIGAQKYAVRIQLDPERLTAKGLGIDEVANSVRAANVNLPTGTLYGEHRAFTVQATGQLLDASAWRPIPVAWRDGAPVRLDELGRVVDGVENDKTASWYNDRRAVVLSVLRQPGTNTVAVVDAVKALLPAFQAQLPATVKLELVNDRSATIRESVRDVKFTLLLTIALVVMVIFLFLRNLSATLIPSFAVPMSLVGTFMAMYALGFSLDNLSLMALTLSVGFVVDDAIVMLENIVRHLEAGETPFAAAVKGAKEIGFTIVSMTISLAAVFIPMLFMPGIIGRLFREFAVTISAAILVSGLVSLTLTPMLCSRYLRDPREHEAGRHSRLFNFTERLFDRWRDLYEKTLRWCLARRRTVLAFTGLMTLATVGLYLLVPKGFLPNDDLGYVFGFTEVAQGSSFDELVRHQKLAAAAVASDPDTDTYFSSVGRAGAASNTGILFARLKPLGQRKVSPEQFIARLRPKLGAIPGINVFLQNPPPIRLGGTLTKGTYSVALRGADLDALYKSAPELEAKLRGVAALTDVSSDLLLRNPQLVIDIDRDRAASLGVSAEQIETALGLAFGGRQVSTLYAPQNQYQVILELLPETQRGPEALNRVFVRAAGGKLVPLATVAALRNSLGPLTVNHVDQMPAVNLSFNLKPGASLGEAVDQVNSLARRTLPDGVGFALQGSAQAFQSSLGGLGILLLISVVVIYMVLGILYESFVHPLTILSGLPSAGFGALLTLWLFGAELNVYGFVGIIMLVGIVKKNAIMMIDFALEAERKEGKSPEAAIFEACLVRFRPIMMTTMAALFGALPIALGIGAGATARRPLGLAVVGGLLVSQLITLYLTPVVYLYLDRAQRGVRARRGAGAAAALPDAAI